MSSSTAQDQLTVPLRDAISDRAGMATSSWQYFFRLVQKYLAPLGFEKSFVLVNSQSSAADVTGLSFNYQRISAAFVEILIQRVTTGTGAVEKIETCLSQFAYKPSSNSWVMLTASPSTAGVTLSVTSAGQVQYTTTNITGTASISKITWRTRTLGAKNSQYSTAGG